MGLATTIAMSIGLAAGGHSLVPENRHREADIVRSISEALAFQQICPALTLDRERVARTLARNGHRIAPLVPAIEAQRPYHLLVVSALGVAEACRKARRLYGPDGTVAAGYLDRR